MSGRQIVMPDCGGSGPDVLRLPVFAVQPRSGRPSTERQRTSLRRRRSRTSLTRAEGEQFGAGGGAVLGAESNMVRVASLPLPAELSFFVP
ncbi:hypothetical protein CJD44_13770 [Streptomyces sp. alain-838]|nr:hypothetical protein CJD44_13770 [Streptomyces sp. alain-838]